MNCDKNSITPIFVMDILVQDVYLKAMPLENVGVLFRANLS
jgi:hypothetical protein